MISHVAKYVRKNTAKNRMAIFSRRAPGRTPEDYTPFLRTAQSSAIASTRALLSGLEIEPNGSRGF